MASKSSSLFFYLMPIISSSASHEKNLVFYLQETNGGPNITAVIVGGVNGTSSTYAFGTIVVFNDPLTAGPERSSMVLGRAQGISERISSTILQLELSLVFHKGKYNGSSLQVQGTSSSFLAPKEFSIAGGTGLFRYARGFVVVTSVACSGFDYTFKYNVTLRLD